MSPLLRVDPEPAALTWLADPDPLVREAAVDALRRRWEWADQEADQEPVSPRPAGSDPHLLARLRELEEDRDPRVAAAVRALWGSARRSDEPRDRDHSDPGGLRTLGIESRVAVGAQVYLVLWQEARRHDPTEVAQQLARIEGTRSGLEDAGLSAAEISRVIERCEREELLVRHGPGRAALARSEEHLRHLVADPSCRVRFSVLSGLWRMIGSLPVPGLVSDLETRLGLDPCAESRARVAMAVAARHDSAACAAAAAEVVRGGDPDQRRWLALIASPEVRANLLGDPDPEVRRRAAQRPARQRFPVQETWPWTPEIEVVDDAALDAGELVAEFERLWRPVLPERSRPSVDPHHLWVRWGQRWRADLGVEQPVEPWLIDIVGDVEAPPARRFAVLEELLAYGVGTRWGPELLAVAGTLLVVEAADADWFPSVWVPWQRVLARLPAPSVNADSYLFAGDPYLVARLCWTPPRAFASDRHVEFWRGTGQALWRSAAESPGSATTLFDPSWRGRLTSLGLTAQRSIVAGSVPEHARISAARIALYAPEGPLAVLRGVPNVPRAGEDPPPTAGR